MSCPVQTQWTVTDSFPPNYMLHWALLDWKYSLITSFVLCSWAHPCNIRHDKERSDWTRWLFWVVAVPVTSVKYVMFCPLPLARMLDLGYPLGVTESFIFWEVLLSHWVMTSLEAVLQRPNTCFHWPFLMFGKRNLAVTFLFRIFFLTSWPPGHWTNN